VKINTGNVTLQHPIDGSTFVVHVSALRLFNMSGQTSGSLLEIVCKDTDQYVISCIRAHKVAHPTTEPNLDVALQTPSESGPPLAEGVRSTSASAKKKSVGKKEMMFLVSWSGLSSEYDEWLPYLNVKNSLALDKYLNSKPNDKELARFRVDSTGIMGGK